MNPSTHFSAGRDAGFRACRFTGLSSPVFVASSPGCAADFVSVFRPPTSVLLLLLGFLLFGQSVRAQTNTPAPATDSPMKLPDLDSLKVGPVKIGAPPVEVGGPGGGLPFEVSNASGATAAGDNAGRGEFVAAPVPFVSPTLGVGLAGGLGYIYRPFSDSTNSPPWITGAGGFYSENGSWAAGLGHKMNLAEDRWRLLGFAGYGSAHYDFFGIGEAAGDNQEYVALSQSVAGGLLEGLYRLTGHFYAGLSYSGSQVTTRFDGSSAPASINDILQGRQLDARLSAPSLRMQWDTRDNQFNPACGWFVDGEVACFDEAWGSDFTFQSAKVTTKYYWSPAERHVFAFSAYGRFTFGEVPFFALSMFGANNNLRGYTVGRYQDRMLLAGQAEYRFQLTQRWGLVAFGGVGAVAPEMDEFRHADPLPSGGFGVRYLIAPGNKVNFRVDVAWGKESHAIYLGVGEAF